MINSLWLDTDIALGAQRGDVDDGFALAAAFRAHQCGQAVVLGISTVNGNTDAHTAIRCAETLMQQAGCVWPVHSGEDAAQEMARLPAGSCIVALGPLTNVARAIALDDLLPQRATLYYIGGVAQPLRAPLLKFSDLNLLTDPAAATSVLTAPWRSLHPCTLDVARQLRAGQTELEDLSHCGALGRYLAEHSDRWLRRAHWRFPLQRSFPIWDLVAVLDVLDQLPQARRRNGQLLGYPSDAAYAAFLNLIRSKPNS